MVNKKLLLSFFCLLFLCLIFSVFVNCQEPASLGDIARRARAEKQKGANGIIPATPAATTSPASTASPESGQTVSSSPSKPVEAQPQQSHTAKATATPPGSGSVPDIPPGGQLGYIEGNEASIRALFELENFSSIDRVADRARATKARFPGGFWQVHIIYGPLSQPERGANAGDAEWRLHLERLKKWIAQSPASVTARIALAQAYQSYAWKARGSGYADSVAEDGWQLFHERLELSGKALADAFALPVKCPEWYLAMQTLLQGLDSSKEIQAAAFEKAVAFEPDYQYYYRIRANSLTEKWGGEEGEMVAFVEKAADRLGGKRGDMIYYQVAHNLNCNCGDDANLHGMSWPRIKRGYMALEEMYGVSLVNLNKVAYMAGIGADPVYANQIFARIGDNWDQTTWKSKTQFEGTRNWSEGASVVKAIEQALSAADENVKTPEGRKFDGEIGKAFAAHYSSVFGDCIKHSDPTFMVPFDLALRLGKDGNVEQIYSSITYEVSACLVPQIEKGKFPAPPRAQYWIKISLKPAAGDGNKLSKEQQGIN